MPLTDRTFSQQATRLLDHYRAGEPVDRFAGWLDELDTAFTASEAVTDAMFTASVTRCIQKRTERGLPLVADLRQYVDAVRPDFVRAAEAPALPAPPRKADGIDPGDPHSCTPEERERWAKEDVWLRSYGARLTPPEPTLLERLSADDREHVLDAHRRNVSVANWVNLTPAARRAKEQRIAAEKAQVPRLIAEARAATRARLDAITAARNADNHPKQAGGQNTVNVTWNDGITRAVTLSSEDRVLQAQRWLKQHGPDAADVPGVPSWPGAQRG